MDLYMEVLHVNLTMVNPVILVENWFLVQYEDQPDTLRVLNEREVKHLDPDDQETMQEGETIQAFWSADKTFYEAQIIKISGECFIILL